MLKNIIFKKILNLNIVGRTLGGGGIQTNHHKSYLFHLVREYYKTLSKLFFGNSLNDLKNFS